MSIIQQKKFRVILTFVLFNCNMNLPAYARIATRYNMYHKLELNFVAGQEENNTNTQQTHTHTHTHTHTYTHKMSIVKYSTLY